MSEQPHHDTYNCTPERVGTTDLWTCTVCSRTVRLVIGDEPLRRTCSGEFGRFDNVTSREAEAKIERLTAELADWEVAADRWAKVIEDERERLTAAEAREAALRAITDKFMVGGVTLSDAQLLVAIKSEMETIR